MARSAHSLTMTALLIIALPAAASAQVLLREPVQKSFTLPAPGELTATVSGRNATLKWSPVQYATGYQIFRKLAAESAYRQIDAVGADKMIYTDGAVLPPGQNQYYVQAVLGQPSNPVTASGPPWPAPNLMLGEIPFGVRLTWAVLSEAKAYQVFRQRDGEAGFSEVTAIPVDPSIVWQEYDEANPVIGRHHNYYVKAVDGEQSNVVTAVPGVPRFSAVNGNCNGSLSFRYSGTGSNAVVQVMMAGGPGGPFSPANVRNSEPGLIETVRNPTTLQYYKLQATYPTGALSSIAIPITIPESAAEPDGRWARLVAPGVVVDWYCRK